jgi:hypothetical protein
MKLAAVVGIVLALTFEAQAADNVTRPPYQQTWPQPNWLGSLSITVTAQTYRQHRNSTKKFKPCMRAPRTQIPQYGQLSHSKAYFTEGALMQPIDKLTRSDFFPDIIGVKEHFAFCHLFRLLHAYSTGYQADLP